MKMNFIDKMMNRAVIMLTPVDWFVLVKVTKPINDVRGNSVERKFYSGLYKVERLGGKKVLTDDSGHLIVDTESLREPTATRIHVYPIRRPSKRSRRKNRRESANKFY